MSKIREQKSDWEPYVNHEGTCAAVRGKNYAVLAGDTRMSLDYTILTRNHPKLYQITDKAVLAFTGMQGDMLALLRQLNINLEWYRHQHNKDMSTPSLAQLLSNTLYNRRFFPYYSFCVLAGIDNDGNGVCYSYDAVGSYQNVSCAANGSGKSLVEPMLDCHMKKEHQTILEAEGGAEGNGEMSAEEAAVLLRETITSASERDIHTGDFVDVWIVSKEGIKKERHLLKLD